MKNWLKSLRVIDDLTEIMLAPVPIDECSITPISVLDYIEGVKKLSSGTKTQALLCPEPA